MKAIELDANERILLQHDIGREDNRPRLTRSLLDLLENGTLVLTNERLVFAKPKGLFRSEYELTSFPLTNMKIIDDVAQAKPAKSKRTDSSYQLTLYLKDRQEVFHFPLKTSMSELKKWVQEINRACTGTVQGWHPEDIGLIDVQKAFDGLKQNVSKTIESAKATTSSLSEAAMPAAKTAFEAAKPLIPVAAAAASAIPSPAGKLAGAVLGAFDAATHQDTQDNTDRTDSTSSDDPTEMSSSVETDPLDAQIEKVKKLKELLDCGILSQEEFEAKKRELLGL